MKRALLWSAVPVLCLELCGAAEPSEATGPSQALFVARPAADLSGQATGESMHDAHSADHATTERGVIVTSDSQAFCAQLVQVIDSHGNGHSEDTMTHIRNLRYEGQRLCDEGHVRLGLSRLREALVLLKGRQNP